jgi:tRNA 2-thiouridine synthesizing protein E
MSKDLEEIGHGFGKAFKEAGDVSVETDPDTQLRNRRERELSNWTVEAGQRVAEQEGLELDDARLQVVRSLQDYYLEHGAVDNGRELGDMLNEQFSAQGGRQYLRQLFPEGPVAQGMKIAGLPVPPHTEDEGFGTAR